MDPPGAALFGLNETVHEGEDVFRGDLMDVASPKSPMNFSMRVRYDRTVSFSEWVLW